MLFQSAAASSLIAAHGEHELANGNSRRFRLLVLVLAVPFVTIATIAMVLSFSAAVIAASITFAFVLTHNGDCVAIKPCNGLFASVPWV